MNYIKNQIRDFTPQSLKALNDNFDNLYLKVFGDINGKDIASKSIDGINIKDGAIDSLQIKEGAIDHVRIGKAEILKAIINDLIADVAKIHDLTVVNAIINDLEVQTIRVGNAKIDTAQIKDLAVTSAKIAKAAIGDAHISDLNADKLTAGEIDTAKVTILGPNGRMKLANNRLQVFDYPNHDLLQPLFERVVLGNINGDDTVYGLRIRGADGVTLMMDEHGIKEEGITDGAITNDKINDNANIDGAKLDIASVITEINNGTTTIRGSKIFLNNKTLEVQISEIIQTETDQGKTIANHTSSIKALNDSIVLKVDSQTYKSDIGDINTVLNTQSSSISILQGKVATIVTETDINELTGRISAAESSIIQQAGQIATKVDVNGVKSTISQNPDSVKVGFNGISDNVVMSSNGITINNGALMVKNNNNVVVIDGSKVALQITTSGYITMTCPSGQSSTSYTITHGLGYNPTAVLFYIDASPEHRIYPVPHIGYTWVLNDYYGIQYVCDCYSTTTQTIFTVNRSDKHVNSGVFTAYFSYQLLNQSPS